MASLDIRNSSAIPPLPHRRARLLVLRPTPGWCRATGTIRAASSLPAKFDGSRHHRLEEHSCPGCVPQDPMTTSPARPTSPATVNAVAASATRAPCAVAAGTIICLSLSSPPPARSHRAHHAGMRTPSPSEIGAPGLWQALQWVRPGCRYPNHRDRAIFGPVYDQGRRLPTYEQPASSSMEIRHDQLFARGGCHSVANTTESSALDQCAVETNTPHVEQPRSAALARKACGQLRSKRKSREAFMAYLGDVSRSSIPSSARNEGAGAMPYD